MFKIRFWQETPSTESNQAASNSERQFIERSMRAELELPEHAPLIAEVRERSVSPEAVERAGAFMGAIMLAQSLQDTASQIRS